MHKSRMTFGLNSGSTRSIITNFGFQRATILGSLEPRGIDCGTNSKKTCPRLTDGQSDGRTDGRTDGRRTRPGDNNSAELKLKAELKMCSQ